MKGLPFQLPESLLDTPEKARRRAVFHLREAEEAAFRLTEFEGPTQETVSAWIKVRRLRRRWSP